LLFADIVGCSVDEVQKTAAHASYSVFTVSYDLIAKDATADCSLQIGTETGSSKWHYKVCSSNQDCSKFTILVYMSVTKSAYLLHIEVRYFAQSLLLQTQNVECTQKLLPQ